MSLALALALAALALAACGDVDLYGSSTFPDAQHGWVTGWDDSVGKTVVLSTADGGATWTRVGARAAPQDGVEIVGWVEFSTPTTGVWARSMGNLVYTTTGGRPWTRATTLKANGAPLKFTGYYSAASFATAKVGWATIIKHDPFADEGGPEGGWIVKTRDRGVTWRVKKAMVPEGMSGGIVDVDSPAGRVCFAIKAGARGGVLFTTDSGATWKRRALPGDSEGYAAVAFAGLKTGWAVGNGGQIAKTKDGGLTWAAQVSGTTENLHGICCLSVTDAYAVGSGGAILVTHNGGDTWTPQTIDTNETLNDVDFVSPMEGWITEDKGVNTGGSFGGNLWHTTDGGVTWG